MCGCVYTGASPLPISPIFIPTSRFVRIYAGKVNTSQIRSLSPGLTGISSKDPVVSICLLGISFLVQQHCAADIVVFSGLVMFNNRKKQTRFNLNLFLKIILASVP